MSILEDAIKKISKEKEIDPKILKQILALEIEFDDLKDAATNNTRQKKIEKIIDENK
tara:strand:- start:167 stop:337 length:171 start_codon:yes stop_codon:yes gene_type:complete